MDTSYKRVMGKTTDCYLQSLDKDEEIKRKKKGNEVHRTITKKIVCNLTEDHKSFINSLDEKQFQDVIDRVLGLLLSRGYTLTKKKERIL